MAGAERAIIRQGEGAAPDPGAADVETPAVPARAAGRIETPWADTVRRPRYVAGLDGLFDGVLRGWAIDLHVPRASVALQLEVKGEALLRLATNEHRADIGSVLEGNVAGFSIDLKNLDPAAAETLAETLKTVELDAPPSPRLLALRVAADDSLIDFGAFGVTAADFLRALGKAPPAPLVLSTVAADARPSDRRSREARALGHVIAHLDGGAAGGRPARRFADHLLAEIERASAVSPATKQHAREIAPLFDPFHYLDRLAAPEEASANPLLHYALAGWRDGVSPSPLFAPDYYAQLRGPIRGDPLLEFVRDGARAGADPHPLFDVAFYRERRLGGDAEVNPLAHYLETGGAQHFDPSPLFDTRRFLEAFGEAADGMTPLEAFVLTPELQDFPIAPAFDSKLYRYQLEIERGERLDEPPYVHYLARGHRDETLLPNLLFDPAFYREHNKLALTEPALAHYLREGEAAGLSCHPFFSPELYNRERGENGAGALEHALAHPGELRSDPRMDAPIDARLFAFVRDLVGENGVEGFHAAIYRETNPDLARLSDAAMEAHYRSRGAREQRIASLTRAMRLARLTVRELPLGFVLADYTSIYPDLRVLRERFVSALFHWGRHGREERRLIGRWKFRLFDLALHLPTAGAPLRVAPADRRVEVCILIHAFYPDLLPELVGFARNFRDVSFDIFINVVDEAWSPALQEELRAICPGAFVMLSNDNGRDIGGFTRLLGHVDIARYDLFAFMHSKKSPHIDPESGAYWRRALLSAIAGSPETASDCVQLFRDNPRIGMIGAKEWRSHDMGANIEQYERLLDLFGVRGKNREVDYLSGFMFLIRSEIVNQLYEGLHRLDFEYGGDRDLEFHKDGQIAHGAERAVPALVRQMGYEIHYR